MGKPTKEELETALQEARRMREEGEDTHHVAKALLNIHYRNDYLQNVLRAVEDYLHSGLAETEHTRLLKAIEKAREADDLSSHRERPSLGL